jgi:FkbM family methyltransferase
MNIGRGEDPGNSGEKKVLEYIHKHFEDLKELIVFDVGANVGQYSLLVKNIFGERAKLYAFEPAKKSYKVLKSTIANITKTYIHQIGLGKTNTKTTLFTDSDKSKLASVFKRKLDHFHIDLKNQEKIEIKTLDTFCKKENIERIHFLKLDVEGNELQVLEGSSRMLKNGKIDFIQFEFGGCNIDSRTYFQDFYYLLKDQYKIFRILKDGIYQIDQYKETYEAFTTTNFLAERK